MLKRCVLIFKLQIFVPKLLNLFLRLYPTFNDLNNWYLVLSLYLICLLVRSTYLALSCFNFFYFLLLFLSYYSCLSLFSFFRLCKLKILWFKHFSLLRRFITFSQPYGRNVYSITRCQNCDLEMECILAEGCAIQVELYFMLLTTNILSAIERFFSEWYR